MKRLRRLMVLLGVFFLFSSGVIIGFGLSQDEKTKNDAQKEYKEKIYRGLDLLGTTLSIVEDKYVDKVDPQKVIYGAIRGLVNSLDSYSQFLTPEDYKELLVETEGEFGGIGVQITIKDGLLTIVSPLEDTPAWREGLEAGDIIVKINDEEIPNITLNEAVSKLRGEPGTTVKITVLKAKTKNFQEYTITREIIKLDDIKNVSILRDGIGYVKIMEFRESTFDNLVKALEKLEKESMRGCIIDLRNNPGGLLTSAVKITSLFLEDGNSIVTTKSRDESDMEYKSLKLKKKYLDIPLVVLINKGSASASEIFASALQDHRRAIIMGETSFGKGSVQTVIPLPDGSALRLTTAKYYTPKGRDIKEKGIDPDIIVVSETKKEVADSQDVFEQLKSERKEFFDYKKDYLIVRALDLLKGILVISNKQ